MQIITLVDFAFNFYTLLLFARIIMTWLPEPRGGSMQAVAGFIYDVTEPFLKLFRKILPTAQLGGMGIDFSPMLAFFVVGLARNMVIQILRQSII